MEGGATLRTVPALTLLSLAACDDTPCPPGSTREAADGLCHLDDFGDEAPGTTPGAQDSAATDTAAVDDTGSPGLTLTPGDPITALTAYDESGLGGDVIEWVEATPLGDAHVVLSGQGGARVYALSDGQPVSEKLFVPRTFRSATDDGVLVLGGRSGALYTWFVDDPAAPRPGPSLTIPVEWGWFEDIALSGDRLLLGFHDRGGVLLDLSGRWLGTIPASDAYAVGLAGDRAVLTDRDELVLVDVSDVSAPAELDRVPMPGEGRDIDFDGTRVAVGMGGLGVGVWDIAADVLVPRGTAFLPGASLDVSLDGDEVWVGAREATALVRVAADGLVVLGLEPPVHSAMAVGAVDGRAVVADWYGVQLLERQRDVAGPELDLDETLRFGAAGETLRTRVRNWGPTALTLTLTPPASDFVVSPQQLEVPPDGTATIALTLPDDLPLAPVSVSWTSNDPDEPAGTLDLKPADRGVGTPHPAFTLQGFTWPDTALQDYTLADQRGRVVVLAYFALF